MKRQKHRMNYKEDKNRIARFIKTHLLSSSPSPLLPIYPIVNPHNISLPFITILTNATNSEPVSAVNRIYSKATNCITKNCITTTASQKNCIIKTASSKLHHQNRITKNSINKTASPNTYNFTRFS